MHGILIKERFKQTDLVITVTRSVLYEMKIPCLAYIVSKVTTELVIVIIGLH